MTDFESLAKETCYTLNAGDLKAICRFRGFSPPKGGGKDALVAYLAPRLLDATGVSQALATLEEKWLLTLHSIAMAESPPDLAQLAKIIKPNDMGFEIQHRTLFRRVAEGLLNRGTVVVGEQKAFSFYQQNRYERLVFYVPDVHGPLLPPYPVPAQPMANDIHPSNSLDFCRAVLKEAVRQTDTAHPDARDGFLGRISSSITFEQGNIRVGKHAVRDATAFLSQIRTVWIKLGAASGKSGANFRAADYILSHLSEKAGVTVADLGEVLSRIGLRTAADELTRFCQQGCQAGFLVGRRDGCNTRYRGVPDADAIRQDGPLVFSAHEHRIQVDLERTGLGPLLELATISRVEPDQGRLHIRPDILLLGRMASRLGSMPVLNQVCKACAAFTEAVKHVQSRHEKLILHEGLLILRIEDLGLRALLARHFGDKLSALGGSYLAVPRDLDGQVEKLARKEGYSPRRIS